MSSDALLNATADASAWPSSYYGRTKRVDLEKFFLKVQEEHAALQEVETQGNDNDNDHEQPVKKAKKVVRFHPGVPVVYEYEPEFDTFERLVSNIQLAKKDTWPSYARKPQRLDLRPIRNVHYNNQCQASMDPSPSSSPSSSSNTNCTDASAPSTWQQDPLMPTPSSSANSARQARFSPPMSPIPHLSSSSDDSSDDDDAPAIPQTPTNAPFSPTTLTRKLTAVFSRKKRF
ncbi:hypothetical protein BC940DRAFT_296136 [Gongronella butleri]|nr:hypothetical protein BC940DRAFT_296136 [Gongronella butleri]